MSPQSRVLAILVSLSLLTITLELVRRGRLREEYSLLFLIGSGISLLLAIFAGTLDRLAIALGIGHGPSLALGIAIFGLTIIQIVQGVIISSLAARNRDLAQKVAQLEWQMRQLCDGTSARTEREDAEPCPESPDSARDKLCRRDAAHTERGAHMGEGPGRGL